MAKKLGLNVLNPLTDDVKEYIYANNDGEGVEVLVEASGSAAAAKMMTEITGVRGEILLLSVFKEPAAIDLRTINFAEQQIIGTRVYTGLDYKDAIDSARVFRDSVTGKQIAIGSSLDFSKQLATLQNELDTLKQAEYKYTEIKSESAGYYIHCSDGYENVLKHSDIDNITVKDVENALNSKPGDVASDVVGRVVSSFKWYLVCAVDTAETVNLSYNKDIYINIPYQGVERLPVTLYKIGERTGDKTMLILSCDLMNDAISDIRIENIEIITEEYRGYKIQNSSIRTVEGEKGVYVVRGNLLGFRKIRVLYSTDSYSIVDNPNGDSDYIKLYDKVVTKGVELYDNKLL
jgi:hypothetical protein